MNTSGPQFLTWWQQSALDVLRSTSDREIATTVLRCIPFENDSYPVATLSEENEPLLDKLVPQLNAPASVKAETLVYSFHPSPKTPLCYEKWPIPVNSTPPVIARKLDEHFWSKMAAVPWQTWMQCCVSIKPSAGQGLWSEALSTSDRIRSNRNGPFDWNQVLQLCKNPVSRWILSEGLDSHDGNCMNLVFYLRDELTLLGQHCQQVSGDIVFWARQCAILSIRLQESFRLHSIRSQANPVVSTDFSFLYTMCKKSPPLAAADLDTASLNSFIMDFLKKDTAWQRFREEVKTTAAANKDLIGKMDDVRKSLLTADVPNYYAAIAMEYGLQDAGCRMMKNNFIPGALTKDAPDYTKYRQRFRVKPGIPFASYLPSASSEADTVLLVELCKALSTIVETRYKTRELSSFAAKSTICKRIFGPW